MSKLLLELGFEELPARFVDNARQQLLNGVQKLLNDQRIAFSQGKSFSTPRRLTVIVEGLSEDQEDLQEEVKGPPASVAFSDGEPTKAALGFARSQGVSVNDLTVKEIDGGSYVFARRFVAGKPVVEVLQEHLPSLIQNLSFPKNMRWGDYDLRFARPLRWLLCLLENQVIPFEIAGTKSANLSYGHRQLAPNPIRLQHPDDYLVALEEGYVIADHNRRRQIIAEQVAAIASKYQCQVFEDNELLDEVTNLVEYPTAFLGRLDQNFLALPAQVLITTMREHQRYFALTNADDQLAPYFIAVRNGADNHLDIVREGNERVLTARLKDAKFFFDEDRRVPLEDYVPQLANIVFQDGLGSVLDKVKRIETLAVKIAEELDWREHLPQIKRTAYLAKADLVTQMVYEFPELQGVMGSEYATLSGENYAVALGIREHYMPRFSGDRVPSTPTGIVVSIADKIDSLVGYFAIGKTPTGSQDPYALRRQALGILQILGENNLDLSIGEIIESGLRLYCDQLEFSFQDVKRSLLTFFGQRLRQVLLDEGFRYDTIDAVLAGFDGNVAGLRRRVRALEDFRRRPEFFALLTAYQRANNLAEKAETEEIDPALFVDSSEKKLFQVLRDTEKAIDDFLQKEKYDYVLGVLAELRQPVDEFFDGVMVMDNDRAIRANRLALLRQLTALFKKIADFRLIVTEV